MFWGLWVLLQGCALPATQWGLWGLMGTMGNTQLPHYSLSSPFSLLLILPINTHKSHHFLSIESSTTEIFSYLCTFNYEPMNEIYATQIRESIEALFARMAQRSTESEMQRMRAAYEMAAEAHRLQHRKSGILHLNIAVDGGDNALRQRAPQFNAQRITDGVHIITHHRQLTVAKLSRDKTVGILDLQYRNIFLGTVGNLPFLVLPIETKN